MIWPFFFGGIFFFTSGLLYLIEFTGNPLRGEHAYYLAAALRDFASDKAEARACDTEPELLNALVAPGMIPWVGNSTKDRRTFTWRGPDLAALCLLLSDVLVASLDIAGQGWAGRAPQKVVRRAGG